MTAHTESRWCDLAFPTVQSLERHRTHGENQIFGIHRDQAIYLKMSTKNCYTTSSITIKEDLKPIILNYSGANFNDLTCIDWFWNVRSASLSIMYLLTLELIAMAINKKMKLLFVWKNLLIHVPI